MIKWSVDLRGKRVFSEHYEGSLYPLENGGFVIMSMRGRADSANPDNFGELKTVELAAAASPALATHLARRPR